MPTNRGRGDDQRSKIKVEFVGCDFQLKMVRDTKKIQTSPCYIGDIIRLESVQRRFTRRLKDFSSLTYHERLIKLNIVSLECRRLHADLTLYYKCLNNMVVISNDIIWLCSNAHSLRGHDKRLFKSSYKINCRAHSFALRQIEAWNSLPQHVVYSSSSSGFRSRLQKIDLSRWLHV